MSDRNNMKPIEVSNEYLNHIQEGRENYDGYDRDEREEFYEKREQLWRAVYDNHQKNSGQGEVSLEEKIACYYLVKDQEYDSLSDVEQVNYFQLRGKFEERYLEDELTADVIDPEFIRFLVDEEHADPTLREGYDFERYYLRELSMTDQARELLIELGADTDREKYLDRDALTYDLRAHLKEVNEGRSNGLQTSYDEELISNLIEHGADKNGEYLAPSHGYYTDPLNGVDYEEEDYTPITWEIKDREVLVRLMDKHSISPDATDRLGESALHYRDEELSQFLIERGADVNLHRAELHRSSPLQDAVRADFDEYAQFLIDKGARIDEVMSDNKSLGHLAESPEMVELLSRAGVDFNAKDNYGNTPLHIVAAKANSNPKISDDLLKTAKAMIESGADPEAINMAGKTPSKNFNASGRGEGFDALIAQYRSTNNPHASHSQENSHSLSR